ncbi:hypothetical protein [Sphingomonas paeninsulae]|uniref:hypothetical protein n=1 Tax=Sphingomonas paeninsulae TaxID=2319844 RepID=UPI0013CF1104|nr:hypothetical protein [Sphingomonas paeninsulae]
MQTSLGVIERAFQIANEGDCQNVTEIRAKLYREGYEQVAMHLRGKVIVTQLRKIIADQG